MRVRATAYLRVQIGALLRARDSLELRRQLHRLQIELGDLVDLLERFLGLRFDFLFGELFVVELDDFLDGAGAVAQVLADLQELLQDQRRARDRFQHQQLAALDALGDGHFAFARQQRNGAHLAQVHAHGVVRLFQRSGSEVEIAVLRSGPPAHLP